jgi:hypothetical protein
MGRVPWRHAMSAADNKRKSLHDATQAPTVYSRILDRDLPVRDARADFTRPAWRSPGERAEVRAFLESKRRIVVLNPNHTTIR